MTVRQTGKKGPFPQKTAFLAKIPRPPRRPAAPPRRPSVPPRRPSVPPRRPSVPPRRPSVPPHRPSVPPHRPSVPPRRPSVPPHRPSVPPRRPSVPPRRPSVPPRRPSVPPRRPWCPHRPPHPLTIQRLRCEGRWSASGASGCRCPPGCRHPSHRSAPGDVRCPPRFAQCRPRPRAEPRRGHFPRQERRGLSRRTGPAGDREDARAHGRRAFAGGADLVCALPALGARVDARAARAVFPLVP